MTGFMGWFLTIVLVLAIFNAEKLPMLKLLIEEKFKTSLDAAKKGSELAKGKIKQVKTDIENKKNVSEDESDSEENTPEEIEESLKFMGDYIKQNSEEKVEQEAVKEEKKEEKAEEKKEDDQDAPIDLEHRY